MRSLLRLKLASLTLNPYFEKSFGKNQEEGIEFNYQWHAKASVNERLALGIEGYGAIPNIGDGNPCAGAQAHL